MPNCCVIAGLHLKKKGIFAEQPKADNKIKLGAVNRIKSKTNVPLDSFPGCRAAGHGLDTVY